MFSFNPELANDGEMEDGDAAFDTYERDEEDDDNAFEYTELDLEALALAAQEASQNQKDVFKSYSISTCCSCLISSQVDGTGTVAAEDRLKSNEEASTSSAQGSSDVVDATPFNENLFLDEALDGLDEQLNDLDLDDSSNDNS